MKNAESQLRLPRRAVLAGLGVGGGATLLGPLVGQARASGAPQRLLIIHRPCGTVPDQWWPTGGVTTWRASPILAEFAALRDDMVILNGINCPRDPNATGSKPAQGMLAMMTPPPPSGVAWPATAGYEAGDPNTTAITAVDESIDQLLRREVPALQAPIASLQLAMSSQLDPASVAAFSYLKAAGQATPSPLLGEPNPTAALQQLLGALPDPVANAALNKSLYDFVSGDITRLHDRAPASQSAKLTAHLEAIKQLELQLVPTLGPLPVAGVGADETADEARYLEVCKQHTQVIKAAFACDATRVITLSFGTAQSSLRFSKILPPGTVSDFDGLYSIGQNTGAQASLAAIERFVARTTAQLLLELKNTPDPAAGGSLLDNTLVVYWSECSIANTHGVQNMPVLAFGGKFLGLHGGSYLTFSNRTMSDFWVATAQAFGYQALTAFGAAEWNTGALPGLFG